MARHAAQDKQVREHVDNVDGSQLAIDLDGEAYLFAGSDGGAERAAALYSLIETAKLNRLDPEAYLRDVLSRIAEHPATKLGDLLPWRWKPLEAAAQAA